MITIHARRKNYLSSALVVSALLVTLLNIPANAKTFSFPHILEKSGTINNTQFTFDSTLVLTYNGSLNGKVKALHTSIFTSMTIKPASPWSAPTEYPSVRPVPMT